MCTLSGLGQARWVSGKPASPSQQTISTSLHAPVGELGTHSGSKLRPRGGPDPVPQYMPDALQINVRGAVHPVVADEDLTTSASGYMIG